MNKVYVVMSNDFPDSVWQVEYEAEKYCEAKRIEGALQERKRTGWPGAASKIYWRVYEFEVRF